MTDLEFIELPNCWPNYPILPVVERGRSPFTERRCGVVVADRGPTVVIGVNIFRMGEDNWLDGLEQKTYSSFEALLVQWRID